MQNEVALVVGVWVKQSCDQKHRFKYCANTSSRFATCQMFSLKECTNFAKRSVIGPDLGSPCTRFFLKNLLGCGVERARLVDRGKQFESSALKQQRHRYERAQPGRKRAGFLPAPGFHSCKFAIWQSAGQVIGSTTPERGGLLGMRPKAKPGPRRVLREQRFLCGVTTSRAWGTPQRRRLGRYLDGQGLYTP